jgi:hypothetical protein
LLFLATIIAFTLATAALGASPRQRTTLDDTAARLYAAAVRGDTAGLVAEVNDVLVATVGLCHQPQTAPLAAFACDLLRSATPVVHDLSRILTRLDDDDGDGDSGDGDAGPRDMHVGTRFPRLHA